MKIKNDMINEKNKYTHIIESCSQFLKAYNYVVLERYTGDTLSGAYWRLRDGKGLVTYQDRRSLVAISKQITRIRRFCSSPVPLTEIEYNYVRDIRESLLEKMEGYRDWLAKGSVPEYLTDLADHEHSRITLELAVGSMAWSCVVSDIEKQKEYWRSVEVDKIIDFDRTIYKKVRSILETVRNNREALDKIAEKYNLTMLPKDKVWQIRADIENRSSKNACINDTMNWICGVRSKSDGHEGILEENDQIIDDFIRWKLMIKEKYKTKQMINDDPAKRIKDFVKEIKVPEYSLEEKEKTSRSHRETIL